MNLEQLFANSKLFLENTNDFRFDDVICEMIEGRMVISVGVDIPDTVMTLAEVTFEDNRFRLYMPPCTVANHDFSQMIYILLSWARKYKK